MSPVQTRKRRRSIAFDSSEGVGQSQKAVDEAVVQNGDSGKSLQDDPEKMADVWEAFREEYYEVLEQLPLTLHRSFALMRELDEQSQAHNVDLLQSLLKYIESRKALGNKLPDLLAKEESQPEISTEQRRTQAPTDIPKSPLKSSQEMLSHIAWLAEEVVRASQEKVNVAQSAYDSADRQIRLLDFAIKEQETSLTLGLKTGNLLPIFGDGVVGRWVRPPRDDMGVDNFGQSFQDDGVPTLGVVTQESIERVPFTNRRKRKGKGRKKSIVLPTTGGPSLKLTVPPLANVVVSVDDMPVDPNEPRYCHCHQVSFGEMVGCDNPNCQGGEWFHLGCVGLDRPPKGEWYCQDCQVQMKAEPVRHGRSRKGR